MNDSFGIRMEKMSTRGNPVRMETILHLLKMMATHGCKFFSHDHTGTYGCDNDSVYVEELESLSESDLAHFVDYDGMAWGRKNANPNWRFGFSFYAESPLWHSCKDIQANEEVMAYARKQGWYLCDHSLTESLVINVGYVIGKHPDLTYRAGLAREIQEHLQSQNPTGPELPIAIGFSRILLGETRIPILAVQCGAS